jgi:hypothetical protein
MSTISSEGKTVKRLQTASGKRLRRVCPTDAEQTTLRQAITAAYAARKPNACRRSSRLATRPEDIRTRARGGSTVSNLYSIYLLTIGRFSLFNLACIRWCRQTAN